MSTLFEVDLLGAARQSVSKHRQYAGQSPTSVPGIPEIPNHWTIRRLKFLLRAPLQYGANEAAELDDPELPRFVRITDVDEAGRLRPETFRSLPEHLARPFLLESGDVLLARSGATVGKTFLYDVSWGRCAYAGYLIRARIHPAIAVPKFVYYFTQATPYKQWISASFIQATIQNVSADKYASLWVPLAPLNEQRSIVAFLDRETARIDRLIADKQRLIDLLDEKRAAVITHAVTKGLDPNAKTKPSGIDWLPSIPSHWTPMRLRHLLKRIEQGWSPDADEREAALDEWAVMRAGCANGGSFDETDHKALPPGVNPDPSLEIRSGDLLMSRACGSKDLVGSVALVGKCRPKLLLCDKLFRLHRLPDRAEAEFLVLSLASHLVRYQLEGDLSGAEGLARNISQSAIKELVLCVPPLDEQRHIVKAISVATRKLDSLRDQVESVIDRLREYRSALITAAVTGRIDVRGMETPR